MVLGGDHDVLHPGLFGQPDPGIRIVLHRIELGGILAVALYRNFATPHDPLSNARDLLPVIRPGGDGIDTPVDEHTEAGLAPPFHPCIAFFFSFVGIGIDRHDLRLTCNVQYDD